MAPITIPERTTEMDRLTKRQREVLELVAEGLTNREVGERLGISQRTVEIHRKDAIIALGVETTVAAVLVLERQKAEAIQAQALELIRRADDELYAPLPNCSCHIAPPCGDCVDHGATREIKADIATFLAEADGM